MSDFKPGDRVRWTGNQSWARNLFGAVGTVVVNDAHSDYVNVVPDIAGETACPVDGQWHANPNEIEKIEEEA